MKTYLLIGLIFITSSAIGQRLRDSLFAGKLKADTGKTFVSKDTGHYVAPKVYDAGSSTSTATSVSPGGIKKDEIVKPDASMPDSLNKTFYQKQKLWKRFIDVNTPIITQQA